MAWRLLNFQYHNIFENMAIDEAIFHETIKSKKAPTIRFYNSQPVAISIGYFQDARKEVNIEKCYSAGVDVARRITGGKAVFHFNEITYSVVAPDQESLFPPDILGTYKMISECIACGLAYLGIKADLVESGRVLSVQKAETYCFSVPSKNELLVKGRKICGSAQVRKRGGFLQHGSLLLAFDPVKTADLLLPARTPDQVEKLKETVTAVNEEIVSPVDVREICSQLKKGFIEKLGIDLMEETLTSAEETLKNKLMGKYNNTRWNILGKNIFN
jgi:lipoyl(octanoyl) transferase